MAILTLTSDTLAASPATGNIEYNGQFYGTDSNSARAQLQRITQSTSVATTSGTSIDFTGIPAWVKRVTVILNGVTNSASAITQIQLGSGTVSTSGYVSVNASLNAGVSNASVTSGHALISSAISTANYVGSVEFKLITGNTWVGTGTTQYFSTTNGGVSTHTSVIALGGALDRVRLTTVAGTATFTAGSINILYEG